MSGRWKRRSEAGVRAQALNRHWAFLIGTNWPLLCCAPPLDSTCAVKGVSVLRVKVSSQELSVRLSSYGDDRCGQPAGRSSPDKSPAWPGCKPAGRNVSELWKVPERLLWRPTRPERGEGCQAGDHKPTHGCPPSAGEHGDGMLGKTLAQHGRPRLVDRSLIQRPFGGRPGWESEGPIVPEKPWKQGGGKGPWFCCAFEGEENQGDWS